MGEPNVGIGARCAGSSLVARAGLGREVFRGRRLLRVLLLVLVWHEIVARRSVGTGRATTVLLLLATAGEDRLGEGRRRGWIGAV